MHESESLALSRLSAAGSGDCLSGLIGPGPGLGQVGFFHRFLLGSFKASSSLGDTSHELH